MMSKLNYKGYVGSINQEGEGEYYNGCYEFVYYHGKIENIKELITYEGKNLEELELKTIKNVKVGVLMIMDDNFVYFDGEETEREFLCKCVEQWHKCDFENPKKALVQIGSLIAEIRHRISELED